MATQFRQLGPDDADAFATRLEAWHQLEGVTLDPVLLRRETWQLLRDSQGWHAWVIESQGHAAGYLMLQFRRGTPLGAPRAYVAALYLIPTFRLLGIGALAHRFVAELSRWLQVPVYEFDTARESKHAHLFSRSAPLAGRRTQPSSMQATA